MENVVPKYVTDLWDEIGYTDEEKEVEIKKMQKDIEQVKSDFIAETIQKCQEHTKAIEEIKEKHLHYLKALKAPQKEINELRASGKEGKIMDRYNEVYDNYQQYLKIVRKRIQQFQEVQMQIELYFHSLGIPPEEQEEYAVIGEDDLSNARLDRFIKKRRDLTDMIDHCTLRFIEIKKQITTMASNLRDETPQEILNYMKKPIFTPDVFNCLEDYLEYLKSLQDERTRLISSKAVEITHLWDLLEISDRDRYTFLTAHSALTQKNIDACDEEIERLTYIRNKQIMHLIRKLKYQVYQACDELSYNEEQKKEIIDKCTKDLQKDEDFEDNDEEQHQSENENDGNSTVKEETTEIIENDEERIKAEERRERRIKIFTNLDLELLHLRKIQIDAQEIIDLIKQRKEIVDEYKELNDPGRKERKLAQKQPKIEPPPPPTTKGRKKRKSKKPVEVVEEVIEIPKPDENDPVRKMTVEKVTRKYKCILPRIEKKLKLLLIDFKTRNNEDFIWNSRPMIQKLDHVILSNTELKLAKKTRRKKSVGKAQKAKDQKPEEKEELKPRAKRMSVAPQAPAPQSPKPKSVRRKRKSAKPQHVSFNPE